MDIYYDTLDSKEAGIQVTKLKEMTVLSKMSLVPWLCFFQMTAHFSITQETSQGSMSLPFPWSICTIIAAALLDYLRFYQKVLSDSHKMCSIKDHCALRILQFPDLHIPAAVEAAVLSCFSLIYHASIHFAAATPCILQVWSFQVLSRRLWDLWDCLLLLNGLSLSSSFLSKGPRYQLLLNRLILTFYWF